MKITDTFLDEHRTLRTRLDELARLAGVDEQADRSPADVWRSPEPFVADLLRHARLEDELLLDRLAPYLGQGGPVEVMRAEHQEIEALLAELSAAADARSAQAPTADLVRLAREHFAKEEQVLFPMAEQLLGEDLLTDLGERHAARVAAGP